MHQGAALEQVTHLVFRGPEGSFSGAKMHISFHATHDKAEIKKPTRFYSGVSMDDEPFSSLGALVVPFSELATRWWMQHWF